VMVAEASYSPTIIMRPAKSNLCLKHTSELDFQIISSHSNPMAPRRIANRGPWAAMVHIGDPPRKVLDDFFSVYHNYFLELKAFLKANYLPKLKENPMIVKGSERSKLLYTQSKDKVQRVIVQWEEFWAHSMGRTNQIGSSISLNSDCSGLVEALVKDAERMMANSKWKPVSGKGGVNVWKMYLSNHPEPNGHKYPLVKAQGIVDASPEEVLEMMVDSSRIKEYNKFSKGRDDLQVLDQNTKVVWNRTWPPLCKRPHDFCSVMHTRRLADNSFIMVTKATEHPRAPVSKAYQRSKILLGVSVMRPIPGDAHKTQLTTYNHVVSAGIPVLIADKVSVKTAADFIVNVNEAFLRA